MLTKKQAETFQLIVSLRNQNKYISLQKLGTILGISRYSTNDRITALVQKGYVQKDESGSSIPTIDGIDQYMKDLPLKRFKR